MAICPTTSKGTRVQELIIHSPSRTTTTAECRTRSCSRQLRSSHRTKLRYHLLRPSHRRKILPPTLPNRARAPVTSLPQRCKHHLSTSSPQVTPHSSRLSSRLHSSRSLKSSTTGRASSSVPCTSGRCARTGRKLASADMV